MTTRRLLLALLLSAICSPLRADQPPVVHERILRASPAEVWKIFATSDGFKAMGVAKADVDLKIGGKIRTHYDPKGELGDDGSIEQTIMSYEPNKMMSFRCSKTPATFPFKTAFAKVWQVAYIDDLGDGRTRLTLKGQGYGDDEESKKCREFFEKGNAYTMDKIQEHLEGKPATAAKSAEKAIDPMPILKKMIGDKWTADVHPPMVAHTTFHDGLGGKFVVSELQLGQNDKFKPHSLLITGVDPINGEPAFWMFMETSEVMRGRLKAIDDHTVSFDWGAGSKNKKVLITYMELSPIDANSYSQKMWASRAARDAGDKPVMDLKYVR